MPASRSARTDSRMWLRDCGSMPTVGSSMIRSSDECVSAQAMFSRRFIPPENFFGRLCACSDSPTNSSVSPMAAWSRGP